MSMTADRWFPRPNVTWTGQDDSVLQANTNVEEKSTGMFSVVSNLPQINTSQIYTLRVENHLVASISRAQIIGTLRDERQRRITKDHKSSWFEFSFSRPECFCVYVFQFQQGAARVGHLSPRRHCRCRLHLLSDVITHTHMSPVWDFLHPHC